MRSNLLKIFICKTLAGLALLVLIFELARLVMLLSFADFSTLAGRNSELFRMLTHGLRYDIRTATLALAPFTLVGLILSTWPAASVKYTRVLRYIFVSLGIAAVVAVVCNYYYYATFGSYFDIFVFGLLEEDTHAVLYNIWDDYPILRFIIGLIISGILFNGATKRLWKQLDNYHWTPWRWPLNVILLVFFVVCYGYGVHGSLGRYPLERRDAQVSSLKLLNMLTPNGIMALDWALSDHKSDNRFPKAEDAEGQKLFSRFYGKAVEKSAVSLHQFDDRTPKNIFLEKNPPHVVFAVMESLSTHLLQYDAPPNSDMLGTWRPYWQRDFTFTRFLSDGNGTMESLARILVTSPVPNISQTRAQRTPFSSNLIKPYKLQGYRTLFITSGNGSWRNLGKFLDLLGFDEVIEQNDLVRKYPEATTGTWGTFDEFSFRYAEERLDEADKKGEKLFIMMLSITNHPPYIVPATFKQPPHHVDEAMRQRLAALPYKVDSVIATLQYSNDTIGRFIQRIEQKPLGKHTIFAATGDHNIRGVGYPDPAETVLNYSVPFYLRVPEEFRKALELKYDPLRVGGHKDIMPTLYALSLSDTPYFRRGVNLLAKTTSTPWYFGVNEALGITEEGAYRLDGPPVFYPWKDKKGLLVAKETAMDESKRSVLDKISAYKSIMLWQLNRQVNRQP